MRPINIADLLSEFLRKEPVHAVSIGTPGRNTGPGAYVGLANGGPQITCCLKGRLQCRIWANGQLQTVTMVPGSVIYRAEDGWLSVANPLEPFKCIGILFGKSTTQYFCAEVSGRRAAGVDKSIRVTSTITLAWPLALPGQLIAQALALCSTRQENQAFLGALTTGLLWEALRSAKDYPTSDMGKARTTFEIAQNHVLLHCSLPLSRKLVANAIRVHPRHLSRLFTRFTGESFAHYLQRIRFERACKLLLDAGVAISDVAAMSGFTSANYFSRTFRREFGMSPGTYRAEMSPRAS